jgi:hypothetical protein
LGLIDIKPQHLGPPHRRPFALPQLRRFNAALLMQSRTSFSIKWPDSGC